MDAGDDDRTLPRARVRGSWWRRFVALFSFDIERTCVTCHGRLGSGSRECEWCSRFAITIDEVAAQFKKTGLEDRERVADAIALERLRVNDMMGLHRMRETSGRMVTDQAYEAGVR
jgi:hypothetical protein